MATRQGRFGGRKTTCEPDTDAPLHSHSDRIFEYRTTAKGCFESPCTLVDVMAMDVGLSGAVYSVFSNVKPMEGRSLIPLFTGEQMQHEGARIQKRGILPAQAWY